MTTTKTTTKTTKTTTAKAATKAARNTPVKKGETKAKKAHVFALVAGMVRKVEHKAMKQAIKYHTAKGNLKLTPKGVELTAQGAALWTKERVEADPAKFQEIAAFIHGGECPKEWKGQPITHAAEGLQFPNMLYWGSFSTGLMRQAFAALWAK